MSYVRVYNKICYVNERGSKLLQVNEFLWESILEKRKK